MELILLRKCVTFKKSMFLSLFHSAAEQGKALGTEYLFIDGSLCWSIETKANFS